MKPAEIEAERRALRLPRKDLAALAGLDVTTVNRTLNAKTSPLIGTVEKMETALRADALRMRDALIGRYGLPAFEDIRRVVPQDGGLP